MFVGKQYQSGQAMYYEIHSILHTSHFKVIVSQLMNMQYCRPSTQDINNDQPLTVYGKIDNNSQFKLHSLIINTASIVIIIMMSFGRKEMAL